MKWGAKQYVSCGLIEALLRIAIICAIAFVLIPELFQQYWVDEAVSYWIASDSFAEMWQRSISFQSQSPLYFAILWFFRQILPDSEFALRAPSSFCILFSLVLYYRLCCKLTDNLTATSATLLLSLSSVVVSAASEIRPYALAHLGVVGSLYFLHSAINYNRKADWGWYIFFSVIVFYSHYIFSLIYLVHL